MEQKLEEIERIQNAIDSVFNKDAKVEVLDSVTSGDLAGIEEARNAINELLQNESAHLTDDQKQALQDTLNDLTAKKELIEEYVEIIEDVKEFADEQPSAELVKEDDRQTLLEAKQNLKDILENPQDASHLTDEEKAELEQRIQQLQQKIERLDEANTAKAAMDNAYAQAALPGVDGVKTDDFEVVSELYEQISDMLENYGGNMSAEELAEYEELFDELKEMYENISKIKEVVELVETNYPNIPADEDLTSDHIELIDKMVAEIQDVLENYAGNLTEEQKADLESKLDVLESKKDILQDTADKLDNIDQMTEQLPEMGTVTSDDKAAMEELISDIEETLAMEPSLLSEADRAALNALKQELEEAIEKLEEVAKEMSGLQNSASSLPSVEEVRTSDKAAVEQLIADIDKMLAEEGAHLSEEECNELLQLKQELQKLIEKVEEVAEEVSDLRDSVAKVPSVDKVKTSDKETLKQLVEDIDEMLAENGKHLSKEEYDGLLQLKKELEKKLNAIEELKKEMDQAVSATTQIPKLDELQISDKDAVLDLIAVIDKLIEENGARLSKEELKQLTDEKVALEEKLEYIEDLIEEKEKEDALETINNAFNTLKDLENPGEDDILLMQQLLERIGQFIADKGTNLSQDEVEHLTSLKSRLQEKIDAAYEQDQNTGTNDDGNANTGQGDEDGTLGDDTSAGEGNKEDTGESDKKGTEKDNEEGTGKDNEEGAGQDSENGTLGGDTAEEGNKEGVGKGTFTVEIYSGQKLVKRITGLKEGEVLDLAEIKDGIYTIVTTNGEHVNTRMLVVEDGESNAATVKGVGNKETEVRFTEEGYRMAVEGLEQVFEIPELNKKMEEVLEAGGSCTIRFVIREPEKTPEMDKMENRAKEEKHSISRVFDFSVAAHLYAVDGKETVIAISDTESLLLTAVPLEEYEKGKAKYYVYRSHEWEEGKGEVVELLPELVGEEMEKPTKEGFYVDDDYVYIWASKYSLYALAYDEEAAPKNCCVWCWLLILLAMLIAAKKYRDYRENRKNH